MVRNGITPNCPASDDVIRHEHNLDHASHIQMAHSSLVAPTNKFQDLIAPIYGSINKKYRIRTVFGVTHQGLEP